MTVQDTTVVTPITDATQTSETTTTVAPATNSEETSKMIPYERFKEVNEMVKSLKEKADEFDRMKKEAEEKKLRDKGDYEKLLEKQKLEYEEKLAVYEKEKFESIKTGILTKYSIDTDLAKFITGSTAEELEEAAKLLSSKIQKTKEEEVIKSLPNTKKEEVSGDIKNLDFSIFFKK